MGFMSFGVSEGGSCTTVGVKVKGVSSVKVEYCQDLVCFHWVMNEY